MADLTPQGQHLHKLLQEMGDWVNRTDIARRLGKKTLNKWDLVLLDKLAERGLIETRKQPYHGPIGFEWQYRIKKE
jgi:hypothetical protein